MTKAGRQRTSEGSVVLPPSRDVAIAAALAASAKQAEDVVILDVHGIIVITDRLVICTATSHRQIRTVIDAVESALREGWASSPSGAKASRKRVGGCWTTWTWSSTYTVPGRARVLRPGTPVERCSASGVGTGSTRRRSLTPTGAVGLELTSWSRS